MKRVTAAAILALTLGATTSATADEIAIALHVEPNNAIYKIAERMKEAIESASNGRHNVVLLGLEVGGERDQIEATSSGEYQIVLGGSVPMSVYAPEYAAADLPFVWKSSAEAAAVYEGKRGEQIQAKLAENGNLHLLGLSLRNPRNLTSNKPVASPADVAGARIRVPQIASWIDIWSEIGALPSPVAWPEVYTSLQTGVIEMQENPVENIHSGKLYEVQTHVSRTEHVYSFFHWLANDEWFEGLSKEDRNLDPERRRRGLRLGRRADGEQPGGHRRRSGEEGHDLRGRRQGGHSAPRPSPRSVGLLIPWLRKCATTCCRS